MDESRNYKELVGKILEFTVLHRCAINKSAATSGLYIGQPPLLEKLAQDGEITQKELADIIRVSPASIATSIKRMQKAGLVEKTSDENDLRYNKISITEKGQSSLKECLSSFRVMDEVMFNGFSDEEISTLENFLDRLIQNLNPDGYSREEIHELMMKNRKCFSEEE